MYTCSTLKQDRHHYIIITMIFKIIYLILISPSKKTKINIIKWRKTYTCTLIVMFCFPCPSTIPTSIPKAWHMHNFGTNSNNNLGIRRLSLSLSHLEIRYPSYINILMGITMLMPRDSRFFTTIINVDYWYHAFTCIPVQCWFLTKNTQMGSSIPMHGLWLEHGIQVNENLHGGITANIHPSILHITSTTFIQGCIGSSVCSSSILPYRVPIYWSFLLGTDSGAAQQFKTHMYTIIHKSKWA